MKLLVTGGAGYIGAHVVRLAEQAGHEVVVVDNFSTGLSQRVQCEVVSLQLASPDAQSELSALMQKHRFDAVVHLAARKQVGESVEIPEQYFLDNLGGLGNLLIAMRENDLHKLVFSSSAATYGIPDVETVSEDYPGKPINPYGQTKLIGEWMVANAAVWGLKGVNLRYFNVAGCEFPDLADTAELNLIPIAIAQLKRGDNPIVFGDDYPTPDGSCIRDYVHVGDLARAHLMAVDYLDATLANTPRSTLALDLGPLCLRFLMHSRARPESTSFRKSRLDEPEIHLDLWLIPQGSKRCLASKRSMTWIRLSAPLGMPRITSSAP